MPGVLGSDLLPGSIPGHPGRRSRGCVGVFTLSPYGLAPDLLRYVTENLGKPWSKPPVPPAAFQASVGRIQVVFTTGRWRVVKPAVFGEDWARVALATTGWLVGARSDATLDDRINGLVRDRLPKWPRMSSSLGSGLNVVSVTRNWSRALMLIAASV